MGLWISRQGGRSSRRSDFEPEGRSEAVGLGEFRALRRRANWLSDLVLYRARHEHATQLAEKYGIHADQQAFGQASIMTTQRYLKTNADQLRDRQDSVEG